MMFNAVGFKTLVGREWKRTFTILNQVVWPPLVSTLLYVVIIGMSIGGRVQTHTGVSYLAYLIPGLVILTVIESSYGESAASLFQHRFMNSIQELLIAPLSYFELLGGFISGSLARALLLGNLLMIFLPVFTGHWPAHWVLYLVLMALISISFSSIGLIMGLISEKWDDIAIPQTFVLMPLIWVGGAFSPLSLLPAPLRTLAYFNPIFYLMDAFRFAVLGVHEAPVWESLSVAVVLCVAALGVILRLLKIGYKLRV
jgi:ABC-2 type transport system permease protein